MQKLVRFPVDHVRISAIACDISVHYLDYSSFSGFILGFMRHSKCNQKGASTSAHLQDIVFADISFNSIASFSVCVFKIFSLA